MTYISLNFQSAKISTAATEASAVDQILHGVHARQDTLERFVTRVSIAALLSTNRLLKKSHLKL